MKTTKLQLLKEEALRRLRKQVNNRVVGVMLSGKSIEGLEKRIKEYKDYDICWVSINLFEVMEDYILSQIGKRLEMVFHSYTLSLSREKKLAYELNHRIPRLRKFMHRPEQNYVLSTWRLMGSNYRSLGLYDFYKEYEKRIILIDYLFDTLTGVNSSILLLATLGVANPKKIITFGLDGTKLDSQNAIHSYYKEELQAKEKRMNYDIGDEREVIVPVTSTSASMEKTFPSIYEDYCNRCGIQKRPEIVNCSPGTMFSIFRNINYNQLKSELDG